MKHFTTSTPGIGGQIKRRYTDFMVEEIRPGGRVCSVERFAGAKDAETFEAAAAERHALEIPENTDPKEFDQLHLDMEKINKDVNFAVRKIARFMQCSKKRVGYAGMKDKRAVTCQRISLFDPDLERLKVFHGMGMELRNPEWSSEKIGLGNLKGNKFTITVRDISLEEKELRGRIENCFSEMKNGIANYFGEQRFGGNRMVTHRVGKEFVKGNPKDAVMLYLTATFAGEEEDIKNARINLSKTMDFSTASKEFPVKYRYERAIIHHLCKFPNDFAGGFRKLPRALCYLFTHAYQSYLFNKIIDARIEAGIGIGKNKGDVLEDGVPTAVLYGFESSLASGEPGKIEKEVLESEGLGLGDFKVKEMPELSSRGSRKVIVLVPQELELQGVEEDEFYEGKLAAKISFSLSKGNYATTVLRELMKPEK